MFCVQLAEINIGVSARFPSTRAFCREYLTHECTDNSLEITTADLEHERVIANRETAEADVPAQGFQNHHLEQQALLRKVAESLPEYNGMLIHGSALMLDGKAYLFTAPSGTGKSTHTRLWRQLLGDRVRMINDDKPILRLQNHGFVIYGSPWKGKHKIGENISAPLAGICVLSQGQSNCISRLTPAEALEPLLQQCYKPVGTDAVLRSLELIDKLLTDVPIYHLVCNMDTAAAELSYKTLIL